MSRRKWEPYEDRYLRTLYPHFPCRVVAEGLGRTESTVYQRAQKLGVHKHPAYFDTEPGGRTTGQRGGHTRFKKGQAPWNKGTNWTAGGRSAETRFGKGHKPHNWVPVGSERVTKDGTLQRKVSDTGYIPRDWKAVHAIKWEQYRGPIPPGHIVIFRNGDRRDFRLRNLQLISRVENMKRNTVWNRYPPEVAGAIHALGQFKRRLREHEEAA
jgi:hypothetical protein